MTMTPDEIKEWLGDPVPVHFHVGNPEPHLTPLAYRTLEELFADALAYIQQLEKRAIHLEALNQSNLTTITMQERTRARFQERISQLESERNAIMQDMNKNCTSCKHSGMNNPDNPCYKFEEQCRDYSNWQWRGVQKEDAHEQ